MLLVSSALGSVRPVAARSTGLVADRCDGCHFGEPDATPELSLVADPAVFDPGQSVTFTLTIAAPAIRTGGVFITTSGVGAFQTLAGEELALNAQGLTHTSPKAAADGAVTFRFVWQAPPDPGGVNFSAVAVAANGNRSSSGDAAAFAAFQWAYGCPGRELYMDFDRDGYGSARLGVLLGCEGDAAPEGYATLDGDCNENDKSVNPGAAEVCNRKDDDCNGEIDENAPPVELWPDADGDGYYATREGAPELGCVGLPGFAAVGGDCDDADPTRYPEAAEICNGADDDCDGDVDDRVRPQCGLGWCARYSSSCDPADCEPGPPGVEICNGFDDDCDGEPDNGACPDGMICQDFECVPDGPPVLGAPVGSEPVTTPPPTTDVVPAAGSTDSMQPSVLPSGSGGHTASAALPSATGTSGGPSVAAPEPSVQPSESAGCAVSATSGSFGRSGAAAYACLALLCFRLWPARRRAVRKNH